MRNTFFFRCGDRVRVYENGHIFNGATGTVLNAPSELCHRVEGWSGCRKIEPSCNGPLTFYWVVFDNPQSNSVASGPCEAAAVAESHLSPVDHGPPEGPDTEEVSGTK